MLTHLIWRGSFKRTDRFYLICIATQYKLQRIIYVQEGIGQQLMNIIIIILIWANGSSVNIINYKIILYSYNSRVFNILFRCPSSAHQTMRPKIGAVDFDRRVPNVYLWRPAHRGSREISNLKNDGKNKKLNSRHGIYRG